MRRRGTVLRRAVILAVAVAGGGCASGGGWHVCDESLLDDYVRGGRPAVVVDIDDTLVDGGPVNSLRLVLGIGHRSVPPFAGAPEVLRDLGKRWNVVLLTARDDALASRTLEWLEASGFPRLPVIFSSSWLLTARAREGFKRRAIERLKAGGLDVELGIGDKPDDLLAYERCKLTTILVLESHRDPDLSRTLEALDLRCWESRSGGLDPERDGGRVPGPWLVLLSRERCWAEIKRRLLAPSQSARSIHLLLLVLE